MYAVKNEYAHTIDWAEYEYVGEDSIYTYYKPAPTMNPYWDGIDDKSSGDE